MAELTGKITTFLLKCVRVWHILRKPGMTEFKTISKVAAIGILLIGLIGFIISILLHIF